MQLIRIHFGPFNWGTIPEHIGACMLSGGRKQLQEIRIAPPVVLPRAVTMTGG